MLARLRSRRARSRRYHAGLRRHLGVSVPRRAPPELRGCHLRPQPEDLRLGVPHRRHCADSLRIRGSGTITVQPLDRDLCWGDPCDQCGLVDALLPRVVAYVRPRRRPCYLRTCRLWGPGSHGIVPRLMRMPNVENRRPEQLVRGWREIPTKCDDGGTASEQTASPAVL